MDLRVRLLCLSNVAARQLLHLVSLFDLDVIILIDFIGCGGCSVFPMIQHHSLGV
jgi:hypothetical protein